MSTAAQGLAAAGPRRRRRMLVAGLIVAAVGLVFAGANAHLLYVAFSSQPDCVAHLKPGDGGTGSMRFSAAKPAC